jgi:hypothetical protein
MMFKGTGTVTKEAFAQRRLWFAERLAVYARRISPLRPLLTAGFVSDLRRLNDALCGTNLHGCYWVWSGLLLGWAREGTVLPHDSLDADFAVLDCDFWRLAEAVPALEKAGFRCYRRFLNNDGEVTEVAFMRHGARFEFFRMFPDDGRLKYFLYGSENGHPLELRASLPDQPTTPFDFVGRTWLRHDDHELELRSMYGSWEIPDPSWSFLSSLDIEAKRPWLRSDWWWRGGAAALADERPIAPDLI